MLVYPAGPYPSNVLLCQIHSLIQIPVVTSWKYWRMKMNKNIWVNPRVHKKTDPGKLKT